MFWCRPVPCGPDDERPPDEQLHLDVEDSFVGRGDDDDEPEAPTDVRRSLIRSLACLSPHRSMGQKMYVWIGRATAPLPGG